MEKYRGKYRIASARAQWWDYGWNGAYFITICTAKRNHYFGKIIDGTVHLSQVGVIADILWHEIPNHASFVKLGDFVVMPNHIHGILILDKPDNYMSETMHASSPHASSPHASSLSVYKKTTKNEQMAKISPKPNSVSTIIRSYKSAVTKHANRLGLDNGWQSHFHDRIIRNAEEYQRISDYIVNNPANWDVDKFQTQSHHK